jgi:hypothetical protein
MRSGQPSGVEVHMLVLLGRARGNIPVRKTGPSL